MQKPFYLTTTLPYVNAELHMGHALEFVRADAIARYHRDILGEDVFFNSGTDEHGSKIFKKAEELGMTAQEFVDMNVAKFHESLGLFGLMDGMHFIRTTDAHHIVAAQEFWKRVSDNGYIYKKNYQTKYCVGCESEKTDSELVDGKCPDHGVAPELIDEENYFFKYSAFGEKLLEFYTKNPTFIIPDFRFNEIKAFIERGLEDFSVSRLATKMPWGIPVPGDADQVMYVWFDALTNYISTLGWPHSAKAPRGTAEVEGDFEKYWVNGTPTQYCGKDNTRFQGAMWQAMLMAAGLPNSHQIVVNGFVMGDGGVKMSKTLGNVVDPKDIAREFGIDALRFFLLKEISSFEDSPFSRERFVESYNAHLANGIGNLTSRIMKMASTNLTQTFEIPEKSLPEAWLTAMDAYDIKAAAECAFHEAKLMDERITETEPFKLVKTDKVAGDAIISELVVRLYTVARMLAPLLPETSRKIKEAVEANTMPSEPLFARK
jgi:methionyl-tRNA synthetase